MEIFELVGEIQQEEQKERWQLSAFNAYLIGAQLGAHEEDSDMNFQKFLNTLGLGEEEPHKTYDNTKEEAIEIANRVLEQFKDWE